MKKSILLFPLLLVGLAACGGGTSENPSVGDSLSTGTSDVVSTPVSTPDSISEVVSTVDSISEETSTPISLADSQVVGSQTVSFAAVEKDQDLSGTTMSGWTIAASKFSYAGAAKLQYADNHIISPATDHAGAVNVKLTIFATGSAGTPWQFDIIGLNASGAAVETKTIGFAELPNTQANAALKTWTLANTGGTIKSVKIIYVQKLVGANIGIINAEIA